MILVFLILIGLPIAIITLKNDKFKKNNNNINTDYSNTNNDYYKYYLTKKFMTDAELDFYNKFKVLESIYKIVPQVNLSTIINKISNRKYQNELNRNIDFAIFSYDYSQLLLLIELNDKTHNTKERIKRDKKVKEICNFVDINLITFYTNCTNEKNYVINRIQKEINKSIENINNKQIK